MGTRFERVVAVVPMLLFSAVCQAAVVQGRVLLPDGKPAAAAPVWLMQYAKVVAEGKTDGAGEFRFSRPGASNTVAAQPRGAAIVWAVFNGSDGGTFTLRARRAVTVHGTVVGFDGKPIAGADVSVPDIASGPRMVSVFSGMPSLLDAAALPGMSVKTGKDGAFAFRGIPDNASARLDARAPHLTRLENGIGMSWMPLAGGGEWATSPFEQGPMTLQLVPMARAVGRVTFAGKPVAGAAVRVLHETWGREYVAAVTDRAGRYELEVDPVKCQIYAEAAGGLLSEPEDLELRSGEAVGSNLRVQRCTRVEGVFPRNALGAKPWSVGIWPIGNTMWPPTAWRTGPIGPDGHFAVPLLPGRWLVYSYSEKGYVTSPVLTISQGQADQVVKLGFEPTSPQKLLISVREHNGAPVANASVVGIWAKRTNRRGEAWVDPSPRDAGVYVASPDLAQFGSGALKKGSDRLRIDLVPGVPCAGRIQDEAGSPIEGAYCGVYVDTASTQPVGTPSNRLWFFVPSDIDGRYRFHLPAGSRYCLIMEKPGLRPVRTAMAEVPQSGEVHVADLTLEPEDRSVAGLVVDVEGQPLPGAPVSARWEPFDGVGLIAERDTCADLHGAFVIRGLPRSADVTVSVRDTTEFGGVGQTAPSGLLTGLKVVGGRKPPTAPNAFAVSGFLFTSYSVDWIQGDSPNIGKDEVPVLFVTAHDPACEAIARAGEGVLGGRRIVVFDAGLPLDELKAYVAKLGIEGAVARVKDGPNLGWGGEGLFERFSVPCVPSWGKVDRAGNPHAAVPEAAGDALRSGPSFPLRYRVRTDGLPTVLGVEARRSDIKPVLPAGMTGARVYTFDVGNSTRRLAIGELGGRPVVVVDGCGTGDPADLQIRPLQPFPFLNSVTVWLGGKTSALGMGKGRHMPAFLGHYEIELSGENTPNESVRVKALGSKVGDFVMGGSKWSCSLTDTDAVLGFTRDDQTTWSKGSIELPLHIGDCYIDGDRAYKIGVDLMGTRITLEPMPEFEDCDYKEDGLTVTGSAYGESWTIVGSDGRIHLPKGLSDWCETFARKASDGRAWTATFVEDSRVRQGSPRMEAGLSIAAIAVVRDGDATTYEARIFTHPGLIPTSVLDPDKKPAKALLEFLDATGRVIDTLALTPVKPGVWSTGRVHPAAAASPRLKIDFGPFKVETGPGVITGRRSVAGPGTGQRVATCQTCEGGAA